MTELEHHPVRIGAVNYLNSKPLIEGLRDMAPDCELLLDYPSRLADNLADGLLDVALIPSVEFLRHPEYEAISDACVATRGAVLSVKLYSRVPAGEIRRLALDEGSRTSAVLAQIMLAERYGVEPELLLLPLGDSTESTSASHLSTDVDAVLLIGDRAMHPPEESFLLTWDLGQEWLDWTGLPFVFALWAARSGSELVDLQEVLCRVRDAGVRNAEEIARREAPLLGISEQAAVDYLTKNLHYQLGQAEMNSLNLFKRLAAKLGLVDEGAELVFRDFQSVK